MGDLSQEELAQRLGTSQPEIARLEAGFGDPRLSTIGRCNVALGTTLEMHLRPSHRARLVEQVLAAWNRNDAAAWADAFLEDAQTLTGGCTTETLITQFLRWHAAFPDGVVEPSSIVEDETTVVLEGLFSGTHSGELATDEGSLTQTGRVLSHRFVSVRRLVGDKIAGLSLYYDRLAALGLEPSRGVVGAY